VIFGHQDIDAEVEQYARKSDKPLLEYQSMDTYIDAFNDFYDEVLINESVVSE
jgi:starch synthase